MDDSAVTFLTLGGLLIVALIADWLGRHTPVPRVSALLLLGVLAGPAGLDVLPDAREQWEPVATDLALAMVGFLLGREFERDRVREYGRSLLLLAVVASLVTSLVVAGGLLLLGADTRVALALGGIAASTAPAATVIVVQDNDAQGPLTRTLLGFVALADALAIVLFTVLLSVGVVVVGEGAPWPLVQEAAQEILGAVLLGLLLGVPAAVITRHVRQGEPTLLDASGTVLLTVGFAAWLDVSLVLTAVTVGVVVSNLDQGDYRPFRAVERVEWPFLVVFFVLGGAALEVEPLREELGLITAYVVLRSLGKLAGAVAGSTGAGQEPRVRRWLGVTLLPQAGVGLGLALQLRERAPEVAEAVVPVVVVSTVLFELLGPVAARVALRRAGEAGAARREDIG